jgi:hypothetical protein
VQEAIAAIRQAGTQPEEAPPEPKEDTAEKEEEKQDERLYANDPLRNHARKRRLEKLLRPLSMTDMDDTFELRQLVPTESLRFEFRTPSQGEMEQVLRLITMEDVGGSYSTNKYVAMVAALATLAIGNVRLPDHRNGDGDYTAESIQKKYAHFCKINQKVVEDCCVQYAWFDARVAKLIAGGDVGNG